MPINIAKIYPLIKEVTKDLKIPFCHYDKKMGWNIDSHLVFGIVGKKRCEEVIRALEDDNVDPLAIFIRDLEEAGAELAKEEPAFSEKMERYKQYYDNSGDSQRYLPVPQMDSYQQSLDRLKVIVDSLKAELLTPPSLQFLAMTKVAPPANSQNSSPEYLAAKRIMKSVGFFPHKTPDLKEAVVQPQEKLENNHHQ